MSSPSNLYAEKVFSEHPLSLWALDDTSDYISLITESYRDLSLWDDGDPDTRSGIYGGTAEVLIETVDKPFLSSCLIELTGDASSSNEAGLNTIECISPDLYNFSSLNSSLGTFSIGVYLRSISEYIASFEIGYEYFDTVSGEVVQKLKRFDTSIIDKWVFGSETFNIPSENTTFRLVIKINHYVSEFNQDPYVFLLNGITFGQWSEEFNATSIGVDKELLPINILGTDGIYGVRARAYGLQDLDGYYLVKDNALVAKNSGIPLVFGASNVTILSPNDNGLPSLVIPGLGFMSNHGRYREYTAEMWLRVLSDATVPKKIFGNVSSQDGLYVDGPFITLRVGETFASHYVGEWTRPMLINIRMSTNSANLVINGEQVIDISFDSESLNLPESDWLGFWAYEDVSPIEVDAVAIYGYKVPTVVSKRRFVYGQGVEFPENINNAYSGSSVFVDYPFANYSGNYQYPNLGRWSQASVENLEIDKNTLSFPSFSLPRVSFDSVSYDQWTSIMLNSQNEDSPFINLEPSGIVNESGKIFFDNLNMLKETTKAFYGVFKELSPNIETQTLFYLEDQSTKDSFEIVISGEDIDYKIVSQSGENVFYSTRKYYPGEKFSVGVDIQKISSYFGGQVSEFFGRSSVIYVYVGGKPGDPNTFSGNIYSIGFCTARNLSKISDTFALAGVMNDAQAINELTYDVDAGDIQYISFWDSILDGGSVASDPTVLLEGHIASYTLVPRLLFDKYILDIAVDSYWEDYIPLSYLGKNVKDARGDDYFDLDVIQFNINFPAPSKFYQTEQTGSWTYEELRSEYSNPVQRGYDSIDNYLFTGYMDYEDLKNKSTKSYKYDTSDSIVKTYISFQTLSSGANAQRTYFNPVSAPASKNGIVEPGSEGEDWTLLRYEVVDNMLIYPPKDMDLEDLAIVTHIEITSPGITTQDIRIRSLEYASLSLSESQSTPIGTRFGNSVYPFTKSGLYYDYKYKNPFSIYKGSTPYLYLTRNSGIRLRGTFDPLVTRGISIPINQTAAPDYKVIASQMSIRFDEDFFPFAPVEIFEMQSRDSYIKFYLVATHPQGKRAKIYAVNQRGEVENGISFYLNGKLVKEPTITVKEWAMLGIRFASTLSFDEYFGAFRITGPLLINNFSHYKSTNLQEVQQRIIRPWFKVKRAAGALDLDWLYWNSVPFLWKEVLVISSTSYYGVDPSDIYKVYTGTNKIIVDDNIPAVVKDYTYSIFKDVEWKKYTVSAV